jgi:hypothetical protein
MIRHTVTKKVVPVSWRFRAPLQLAWVSDGSAAQLEDSLSELADWPSGCSNFKFYRKKHKLGRWVSTKGTITGYT